MNDRELLEYAAKAAGIIIDQISDDEIIIDIGHGGTKFWRPLTDDGDALRLAVKLRISINFAIGIDDEECIEATSDKAIGNATYASIDGSLENSARRTIVRAAAEIGKTK